MGNWFTDGAKEIGGSASDLWAGATGGETRAEQEQRLRQQAAMAVGEKHRSDLAQQQQGLHIQGHDPASINQHDNWGDWDQARLANELKPSLQVGRINASGRAWENLGKEIAELFADLDARARGAAESGMRGQAAEAGFRAAEPLQKWGLEFGDSVRGTGLKIQEAGVAAEQTKAQLQPPEDYNTTRTVMATMVSPVGGIMDAGAQMREREEANKQARQVVQNVYTPGYTAVDSSTPTFPPPVDPLNPQPPPDEGRNQHNITGKTSTETSGNDRTGNTGIADRSIPDPNSDRDGYSRPPAQTGSQWANPTTPHPGGLPGTPPGVQPPSGGAAFVGTLPPGGGAAGGTGAGGRGAGGMGAGGRAGVGGPGLGAGGRAGVGGLGAGAGGLGAGAGAAGATAARGGAGAGMGAAGAGQRGQGSEDEDHDRPSWLEEQDDVWLDDMPRTAPPVFGE
ncbi:hypothetical protein [Saccharopolyspora sp. 5N708]|uniref:hypothetical protein n=1 Tax=Saccharopolyspora sp. 5N708 TaxID=3457424 RepID=UPI003FD047CE